MSRFKSGQWQLFSKTHSVLYINVLFKLECEVHYYYLSQD
jgi:hypothetical protein